MFAQKGVDMHAFNYTISSYRNMHKSIHKNMYVSISVLASFARIATPLGMSETWTAARKRARVLARAHCLYPG